mmetsp:Transcript_62093/g.183510  ORF Transcript_62093/g.183510 Transcript_62093/m.183510 type:complete len:263 (-) Transcript_62093:340-1128(-)
MLGGVAHDLFHTLLDLLPRVSLELSPPQSDAPAVALAGKFAVVFKTRLLGRVDQFGAFRAREHVVNEINRGMVRRGVLEEGPVAPRVQPHAIGHAAVGGVLGRVRVVPHLLGYRRGRQDVAAGAAHHDDGDVHVLLGPPRLLVGLGLHTVHVIGLVGPVGRVDHHECGRSGVLRDAREHHGGEVGVVGNDGHVAVNFVAVFQRAGVLRLRLLPDAVDGIGQHRGGLHLEEGPPRRLRAESGHHRVQRRDDGRVTPLHYGRLL